MGIRYEAVREACAELMQRIRRHCTYANVTASLALFVALSGGTALAAIVITGANVRNGSLTGADMKDGSLTGADVGNGKLTGTDLAASTVTGNNIANGGIGGLDIAFGAITGNHIGNGAVGAGKIADGSVDDSAVQNGSLSLADLAQPTIDALTLSSVDGSECSRQATTGTLHLEYPANGYAALFCEIPLTADSMEPNESQLAAASLADPGTGLGVTYDLTFHDPADTDWFTHTYSQDNPCLSGSIDILGVYAKGQVTTDIWQDGVAQNVTPPAGLNGLIYETEMLCGGPITFVIHMANTHPSGADDAYQLRIRRTRF